MTAQHSFCRLCLNGCALIVEVDDNRAVRIAGDKDNPVYRGFTCVKGREQGRLLADDRRLRTSLKRQSDGTFRPIPVADAIAEIAERLDAILSAHGPSAIAGYLGTFFAASAATMPLFGGFMEAIGSPMAFSPGTIDKPGKKIAQALHGAWGAPAVGFDDPEVILLLGSNPLITFTGFPYGNPGKWLNDRLAAGTKLFVVDPRRTDVARRAHIHLQSRPGEDVSIIAGLIRIILAEKLYDAAFVEQYTRGLAELTAAVEEFTAERVGECAGIDPDDLRAIARALTATRRGYINAGTGPNMAGRGTLTEYLLLVLHTLCGYWLREGDKVRHPGALAATLTPRAEVLPRTPAYGFGIDLGVRSLTSTAAGLPTAALPDLMLRDDEPRIRAMISCGGNPVAAWPDQTKTIAALDRLELLVQIDPWMSATATLADYVIAPQIWLEVAGTSQVLDWLTRNGTGYGQADPYAQYSPALLNPPPGSDLIEEWAFFYELARALGRQVRISPALGPAMPPIPLDMSRRPSTDDVLEILCRGARIPLSDVKMIDGGAIFPGHPVHVAAGHGEERFELADRQMMADLSGETGRPRSGNYRFRLLCRRMMHVYNSAFVGALPSSIRPYNPVCLHPDDMVSLVLVDGDVVTITSDKGSIPAIVAADPTLRRGTASMSFGFGRLPRDDPDFRRIGSNPARLLSNDDVYDSYSGQPLMTNIPVDIRAADTEIFEEMQ
ncbi:molybdopterin-dependent oxidoreductase [Sphingomonas floccifaciens]|uniref:Molybdopterin-dependent oxidoreductase n=1 Tax=Sphingomonas floccifaciens TaxID=1844115 RepID=A0ABW4NJ41_9SPHN